MREVRFFKDNQNLEAKEIKLFTKYHNLKKSFTLKSKTISLPLSKKSEYYVFDDERFFVCEGEGELYYLDCTKFYDFREIDTYVLDCYLIQGTIPTQTSQKQRKLISDFLKVYDLNLLHDKLYLNPLGFEEAQRELLC